jgi:hypothetical protein
LNRPGAVVEDHVIVGPRHCCNSRSLVSLDALPSDAATQIGKPYKQPVPIPYVHLPWVGAGTVPKGTRSDFFEWLCTTSGRAPRDGRLGWRRTSTGCETRLIL